MQDLRALMGQLMAAGGADALGNTPGQNTNKAVQQDIASTDYMRLLARMLQGEEIPEGGSVTHKEDGTTIKVPKQKGMKIPNPLGGQGFSPSDLAGVTPEMISSAIQFKNQREELGNRRLMDVVQTMYQLGVLPQYYQGMLQNERQRQGLEEQGLEIRRLAEARQTWEAMNKDERTEAQKNYAFAVSPAGGGYTKSFANFMHPDETTNWKDYQLAGGKEGTGLGYEEWMTKHEGNKAIKLTTGEKVAEKLAMGAVEPRLQLKDPSALQRSINTAINNATDVDTMAGLVDPNKAPKIKAKIAIETIEGMIHTGGGTIVSPPKWDKDGRTVIWEVRWPPLPGETEGKTEVIRHAVR